MSVNSIDPQATHRSDEELVQADAKRKQGQIDGEKQARGIAQGMLKATCSALAHLSKE
jgi:hypothetical protein